MATSSASSKKPAKSILKKTAEQHEDKNKGASFDEMNILATYHPANKDYGHMKIDEPKTPYRNDPNNPGDLDAEDISQRLAHAGSPTVCRPRRNSNRSDDGTDDEKFMTPEEKEHMRRFKEHRKEHYNMKEQLKKAKELLAQEMAELED